LLPKGNGESRTLCLRYLLEFVRHRKDSVVERGLQGLPPEERF